MEVSSAMLVALMFVGLLSIGIANILMGLAAMLDNRAKISFDWIFASWILLLLLVCFDLFWDTTVILSREEWGFAGFLLIVLGPILVIFGGQVVLPDLSRFEDLDLKVHFATASRDFFILLALLETWQISVDLLIGGGLGAVNGGNVATAVLMVGLALTRRPQIHRAGAVIAWSIFLVAVFLRVSAGGG